MYSRTLEETKRVKMQINAKSFYAVKNPEVRSYMFWLGCARTLPDGSVTQMHTRAGMRTNPIWRGTAIVKMVRGTNLEVATVCADQQSSYHSY